MTEQTPDLTGAWAAVLGANDAMGAAVALALAQAGADVAMTSTTGDAEEAFSLRPLRRRIEALGRRAIADIADLGNGSSVQIALRQISKQTGRIDTVVVAPREPLLKPAERMTDAEWSRALGFNLDAYFYAARGAAKEMAHNQTSPRGRIVLLLPFVEPAPGAVALIAAWAGAEALTGALAREWAETGITVNAVALGPASDEAAVLRASAEVLRLATSDETGRTVSI